ncbi:hypothetical protein DY000_02054205 [Brassica cretica]|uniref:Uncharacterized protein n=1 Tax=Brassica cretica TaxID=69181 RepID=A0ABQ7AD33_BRACR|nr:hypothetical protein DY000_02054205 [Brassica cretica]
MVSLMHGIHLRHLFPTDMASSSSGKRASRRTQSNYSSSLRRDMTEEKDEKIVPNLCVWTLVEDNENNERPNELKYLSTMLVVADRTKFEEMDLLAYGGAWDDDYENDDDDYAEKWRRRGNGSATGSFGSGSERSKVWKRV